MPTCGHIEPYLEGLDYYEVGLLNAPYYEVVNVLSGVFVAHVAHVM